MLLLPVLNLVHGHVLGAATTSQCPARLSMGVSSDDHLLPFVALSTGDSTAEIHLFGGCVTSYSKDGVELLAHRHDSKLDGVKPISGGIPFCFPQFGPGALQPCTETTTVLALAATVSSVYPLVHSGALQQHGFARNLDWEIASTMGGAAPSVVLGPAEGACNIMCPAATACVQAATTCPGSSRMCRCCNCVCPGAAADRERVYACHVRQHVGTMALGPCPCPCPCPCGCACSPCPNSACASARTRTRNRNRKKPYPNPGAHLL